MDYKRSSHNGMLPSRRDRNARTPRAAPTPTVPISFTAHDWSHNNASSSRSRPQSARSTRKKPTSTSKNNKSKQQHRNRRSSSSNKFVSSNTSGIFGDDNLRELERLTTLTQQERKQKAQAREYKHNHKDPEVIVNAAVRKLRQVFENKHSLREMYVAYRDCLTHLFTKNMKNH